ncbi:hypothetical protein F4776DRAFT_58591 [Hypoxylon sp. NC0597]|nr:hypothetical protein F4776DRAFT_58591 [Hypoxylon sp. NC0597]
MDGTFLFQYPRGYERPRMSSYFKTFSVTFILSAVELLLRQKSSHYSIISPADLFQDQYFLLFANSSSMTRTVAQWEAELRGAKRDTLAFLAALCEIHHMTSFSSSLSCYYLSHNLQKDSAFWASGLKTLANKILHNLSPSEAVASFGQAFCKLCTSFSQDVRNNLDSSENVPLPNSSWYTAIPTVLPGAAGVRVSHRQHVGV